MISEEEIENKITFILRSCGITTYIDIISLAAKIKPR